MALSLMQDSSGIKLFMTIKSCGIKLFMTIKSMLKWIYTIEMSSDYHAA